MIEIILCGTVVAVFILVEARRLLRTPETFYMRVCLVLKSEVNSANKDNPWLLTRFCRFRIVPRVGDTLDFLNGQFLGVTEVQLLTNTSVEVWCDVEVPEELLEETAKDYCEKKGWSFAGGVSEKRFHFKVNEGKIESRKGFGVALKSRESIR